MSLRLYILVAGLLVTATSCKKYLDAKPDKKLAVPTTVEDLQAILNNTQLFNVNTPMSGELASDNIWFSTEAWKGLTTQTEKSAYIWDKEIFTDGAVNDWSYCYRIIYNCNVILEQIEANATPSQQVAYNEIKGQALFYRAQSFFNLLQLFSKPYSDGSAAGVPLRIKSDLNLAYPRATVSQSYQQALDDARTAVSLLSATTLYKTRPTKSAGSGLLARIYLAMGDYNNAARYATDALTGSPLIDYNTLSTAAMYPFSRFNSEVIFHTSIYPVGSLVISARVDSVLYQQFGDDDLRKSLFFKEGQDGVTFKGSYDGSLMLFSGLASDEMYLIKAECEARTGKIPQAMATLNSLLVTRWKTGTYVGKTAQTADDALAQILTERRKELLLRGIRFADLKRLNQQPATGTVLKRVLNGQTYTLPAGDIRYQLQIPIDVIKMSGISQNPYP